MSEGSEGSSMYREDILEHYKNPENFGTLKSSTFDHKGENPLCGDTLEIQVQLDEDDHIVHARFQGQGCAISQASTDILLSEIRDTPLDDVLAMGEEEILALLGIEVSPLRVKCAVLPLVTIHDGARIHRGEIEQTDVTRTEL